MTFEEMCQKEPRLKLLEQDCIDYLDRHPDVFERDAAWNRVFKKRMKNLVGFMAANPELSSCDCYEIAYRRLNDALEV